MKHIIKKRQARITRHHRIRNKISGTHDIPRLNVFKSNQHIHVQLIDDIAQTTIASATTLNHENGRCNIEWAQVIGKEIAQKATKAHITQVVFDRGGYKYHGVVKALADAARANGLKF